MLECAVLTYRADTREHYVHVTGSHRRGTKADTCPPTFAQLAHGPRDTRLRVEAHTSPHRCRLEPAPLRAPTTSAHREGKEHRARAMGTRVTAVDGAHQR
jgi:hypothetical protein